MCGGSVAAMNFAELLDRIEEAAVNGDVVEALLLCQKLGGDADSAELQEWSERELERYPQGEPPPDYRWIPGQFFASGAAPMTRLSAVPIPLEALPEPERSFYDKGIPVVNSISEIAERATESRVAVRPSNVVRLLNAVNASNEALTMFDDIYIRTTGPAFGTVVTVVRSRIVKLVAQLRVSLAAGQQLDSAAVGAAMSYVMTGSVVNVTGNNNVVTVGDSGDVNVTTAADGGTSTEPTARVWRWVKRILEAITAFGAAVGLVGGGSFNPF